MKASNISRSITNSSSRSGHTFRPLSVIIPSDSNRRHRSLFSSVQHPLLRLGPKRCRATPSTHLSVESIHPKHKASSTASRYHRVSSGGVLPRLTAIQHSCLTEWFVSSHFAKLLSGGDRQNLLNCHRLDGMMVICVSWSGTCGEPFPRRMPLHHAP